MTTNTPEGWKLVPVEPTPEMIGKGIIAYDGKCESAYRAMLAAAPSPPPISGSADEQK